MEINQRNVFGDNVVITNPDRGLTDDLAAMILGAIEEPVKNVAIHYEYDGETKDFVEQIAGLLQSRGYGSTITPHGQSEIPRNTITVEPSEDPDWAYVRVGTR